MRRTTWVMAGAVMSMNLLCRRDPSLRGERSLARASERSPRRLGSRRHNRFMDMTAPAITQVVRRIPWSAAQTRHPEPLLTREWLVTNGLGGYASGTVAGVATRRYHGLLVAALPAPLGRCVM